MKLCINCGGAILAATRRCPHCGHDCKPWLSLKGDSHE